VFVFVGQLFMLQLFVSVIIDSYNFTEGSGLLTGVQALYMDLLKLCNMLLPEIKPEPMPGWREKCYNCFMDTDPLPVPGLEEMLDPFTEPLGQQRFDITAMEDVAEDKRTLALIQGDLAKDPGNSALRQEVEALETRVKKLDQDIDFCNRFSEESLAAQPRPSGFEFVIGLYFDHVITVCIVCNIMFMCTVHWQQTQDWTDIQQLQNYIFLFAFVVEFVMKHIGLGFQQYWGDAFNAFDGIVVLMSLLFVFVPGGAIAGLFRIGRVFRLLKRAPQLRALMVSMIMVVPTISNVFSVMFLLFFVYSVIGVQLFAGVRYGFSVNQDNNYQTWPQAMMSLWRATLGNWRQTMYDTQVQAPFCTEGIEQIVNETYGQVSFKVNDCGGPIMSMFYHVSFQFFSTFAVLNVVIAIILGAFTWCYSLEQGELTSGLPVTADNLRHFKMIWDRFDLYSSGKLEIDKLQFFLAIVRWNIPELFSTGVCTQEDEEEFRDYSSFDLEEDPGGDSDMRKLMQRKAKECYEELVERIGNFERSAELWRQLDAANCNVWMGANDNVAGFDAKMHPLGSVLDPDLHIFTKEVNNGFIIAKPWRLGEEAEPTKVVSVSFTSMIRILSMDPLNLTEHDIYVCSGFKDPFSYFQPGYFADKNPGKGKIELELDPNSIKPPQMEKLTPSPSAKSGQPLPPELKAVEPPQANEESIEEESEEGSAEEEVEEENGKATVQI